MPRRSVRRECGSASSAAGALGGDDAAVALHAVPDRDLAGGGRVEPRDRLVGADELGPLPHSFWISPWPNSLPPDELAVTTAIAYGSCSAGIEARVVERHLGRRQRHPGPAVGLDREPALDVVLGVEAVDLAGERVA